MKSGKEGAPLLELRGIQKSFGAVRALQGVDFELRRGEIHALVGENGAGKSTLIKTIAGAHVPDEGSIRLDGVECPALTPRTSRERGIAVIHQQPALLPDLTVAENIALFLEPLQAFRRVRWDERTRRAEDLLRRLGADIDPETDVASLSMPGQQLVEIARALGAGAMLLVLDEPTSSLSASESARLLDVLRGLRRDGVGCIYISHRLEEISDIADRVTVLRDGKSVGTFDMRETSPAALIRLMIGRDPKTEQGSNRRVRGPACLEIDSISSACSGLDQICFTLHEGEIFGLAGLVGSGRTELARILFGLDHADTGTVRMHGVEVRIDSPMRARELGIAYVPEDRRRHGVIPEMSIAANVSLASHDRLFPRGWLREASEIQEANRWIQHLGIKAEGPCAPVESLSGGNQQKVAVGRWLATSPKLLIVDEPTQGVDVGAKLEMHRILSALADGGMAILWISSDLPEVLVMSDRVGVMRRGRLAAVFEKHQATPQAVMEAAVGGNAAHETPHS